MISVLFTYCEFVYLYFNTHINFRATLKKANEINEKPREESRKNKDVKHQLG